MMKNDKNRIYFKNYERISPEKELEKVLSVLRENDCEIGEKCETPLDDLYECRVKGEVFTVIRAEDEAFIYAEDFGTIQRLLQIFEQDEKSK